MPEHHAILLRPRLRAFEERCVLTHEIVHAEWGDTTGHTGKPEHRAHRIAAERLVDPRELAALHRLYGTSDRLCHELGVTREILTAALETAIAS